MAKPGDPRQTPKPRRIKLSWKENKTYPRKVSVTKRQLDEFYESECHNNDLEEILKRHHVRGASPAIEFRTADEAYEIWAALCLGTMQVLDEAFVQEGTCTHKMALRLADRLKETVMELAPEAAAKYPFPTGY